MLKKLVFVLLFLCVVFLSGHSLWEDSIHNPANEPYILEVAFNLGIDPSEVTRGQFTNRYR